MTTLRTKRLFLREFDPADLPAYAAFRDDPEFGRHYPVEEMTSQTSKELLQRFLGWSAETPRLRYQLAIEKSGVGLMGSVGVRIVEGSPRTASFGCELGRKHWGHGYACEAARALIGFAFLELGVETVFAETTAGNTAALGLAIKLGMRPEPDSGASPDRAADAVTLVLRSADWMV